MFKNLMMSAAVSALMISGAMAQADPPGESAAGKRRDAETGGRCEVHFVAERRPVGVLEIQGHDVIGPDNAQVGDVNDVLFDKSGKILALIVGVGGFLGIGEKNVAIDMSAFQVVPASTGSAPARRGAGGSDDPTNVKLKVSWTKDQLKNAPDFQYYKPAATPATHESAPPAVVGAPNARHRRR